ncbi:lysophospholipid acyltransferase family protein [Oryzomicrobium sp.]|uniref:lysophospholipid acyltransferase family protein n=1 Tax=Oryzomicrobium sp. TaxID=1911578 RepID=UPI002FDFB9DD
MSFHLASPKLNAPAPSLAHPDGNAAAAPDTLSRTAPRPTTRVVRLFRCARLALHLVQGVLTLMLVYPWTSPRHRRALKRRWARQLLAMLGFALEVRHADGAVLPPAGLVVANHVSWIDIYALNATLPVAFVSKAEVRQWPVIGWLAAHTDTIFLRRGSRGHAKVVNGEIESAMTAGAHVALFPEGTTTDGTHLLHFHGALLQPAVETGLPVIPIALSYHEADGRPSLAPAYAGDTTMGQCLGAILTRRRLIVRVQILPPLDTGPDSPCADRRTLARTARASIANALGFAVD